MADSRLKNSMRNTVAGIVNKVIAMIFPFIIRTVIIKELGTDYLGLNSLFSSVLNVLSISELGFSSAMVYSMYKPVADNDTVKICALLKLYRRIFRIIGLVILGIGLAIMPFLEYFISGEVEADVNIYILYLVFLLNSVISYLMFSYKSTLLTANQREDINSKCLTYTQSGMYIAQICVLVVVKKYMPYIILMPISTIICNIIRSIWCDKLFPEYKCEGDIPQKELKDIYKNVKSLFGFKISGTIVTSSDNIVISAFLGLTAVAVFNNYYTVIHSLVGFFTMFYAAVKPSIGNSMAKESIEKNYNNLKCATTIAVWLAGFCAICLLCLYQPFMTLWVGEEYLLPFSTVIMLSVRFFEWKAADCVIMFRDAAGLWYYNRAVPYITAALNLVGNIVLVSHFGLNGIMFATLFTSICINLPSTIWVLFTQYFKKSAKEFVLMITIESVIVIIVALVTYAIVSLLPNSGYLAFASKCVVCVVIPNILFIVSLGREKNVREFLLGIIKRSGIKMPTAVSKK